jgi:TonB family protein
LFDAFFARHNAAFNRLDSETALEWLDDADALALQPERIAAAREQIYDFIAAEAATESIAAAQLEVRSYVPPDYPASALRRNLEGWVDVAFVLSRDGETMNVEAVDASSSIFRSAATSAVEQWQFEPHVVRDRVVEQHAHTRIRFVLED